MSEENKVTISFENGDEHEVEMEPTEVVVTIGVPKRHIKAKLEMEKKFPHRIGKWEEEIDERLYHILMRVEGVYHADTLDNMLWYVTGDMSAKEVSVALDAFKASLDLQPMSDSEFFEFTQEHRIPGMGLPFKRGKIEVKLKAETARRLKEAAARLAMNEQTLSSNLISTMDDEVMRYEKHLVREEEKRKAYEQEREWRRIARENPDEYRASLKPSAPGAIRFGVSPLVYADFLDDPYTPYKSEWDVPDNEPRIIATGWDYDMLSEIVALGTVVVPPERDVVGLRNAHYAHLNPLTGEYDKTIKLDGRLPIPPRQERDE